MSLRYTILPEQHLILVKFEGPCSVSQFINSAAVICADKRYVRGFDGLINLSHLTVSIALHDIEQLVEFTLSKHKHGHGKWGVLVTTPMATAFTMLFHQGVTAEYSFSIFSSWDGVSTFLGRSIDRTLFEQGLSR